MQNVIKSYTQITKPKYAVIAVLIISIVFAMPRLLKAVTRQIWRSLSSVCIEKNAIYYTKPKYRLTAIINPYPCMTMPISYKPSTSQIGSHKPLPKTGNRYKKDKNICKKRLDK